MVTDRFNKYWALIILILVVIIASGSGIIWSKYSQSQIIEISLAPSPVLRGEIHISGAVNNPGFYPLAADDSLGDIIRAAGGTTDGADLSQIRLHISKLGDGEQVQKVDINRAEAWLLQALPGIGETRAQAIIDYRQQNGRFRHITELLKVNGIGLTTYERIKYLVMVAD